MIRVYFDKQIFSFLRKNDTPKYQKLNEELKKYSSIFLYIYSHAHLLDLKNDTTDHKYKDLEFMEDLVSDNYLLHPWKEKQAYCYLATPLEAFNGIADIQDSSNDNLLDIFDNVFGELPNGQELKDSLFNQSVLDLNSLGIENITPESIQILNKFIPTDKSDITFKDIIERLSALYNNFNQNQDDYKDLRRYITQTLNLPKFDIDYNNINFNEELKNTPLGKTFIEFVEQSINPDKDKEITIDTFFQSAFTSLNLLGIDKEKNKKAYFKNTTNDAQHGYYGAYCDYVVSDDIGFLNKCKVLYKLLGIDTKVLHIDDFCRDINLIGNILERDLETFIRLLKFDLQHSLVVKSQNYKGSEITTIKTQQLYLGFFNAIDRVTTSSSDYIVLCDYKENYSNFCFYKEYKSITNKLFNLIGEDISFRGSFSEKDQTEIELGKWQGRKWKIIDVEFNLEINKNGDLNFIIGPLKY